MRERLRRWWQSTRAWWLRWRRRISWILFIGTLLAGVSLSGWWLLREHPQDAAEEARKATAPQDIRALERKDRVFATGGQLLLGVAVILGAGFALWRVLVLDKQVKITEQGQITERFTRAIEQLGDEHRRTAVRLGGIYALERIARDSPRDHPEVMEVLCAFVREETGGPVAGAEKETTEAPAEDSDMRGGQDPGPPSTVVQAALEVIGRNPLSPGHDCHRRLNLQGVRIPLAKLSNARLSGADFLGSDLSWAFLDQADLSGAILFSANLMGADLSRANLTEANLLKANLTVTNLSGADLRKIVFLTREQIGSARIDEHTKLPEGFRKEEGKE